MRLIPKLLLLLLAGLLSVFYAEVLSGSSILWFSDIFGYIFLLPLYMFHLLVLFNIAVRVNRTSPRSLYLFGVIFGLYETWMTKVDWAGFSDSGKPILGTPLGFAVAEMSIVSFIWHPFMSFIAPLITIKILSMHLGNEDSCNIDLLIIKNKVSLFFYVFLILFAGSALALNSGGNLFISASGFFGSLALITLIYLIIKRMDRETISLDNLIVGKIGLVIMIAYLAFLYILFFFVVRPGEIPGPITIMLTILIYLILFMGIYLDKDSFKGEERELGELFKFSDLLRFYILVFILVIVFSLISNIAYVFIAGMFFITIILGFIIIAYNLITIVYRAVRRRGLRAVS